MESAPYLFVSLKLENRRVRALNIVYIPNKNDEKKMCCWFGNSEFFLYTGEGAFIVNNGIRTKDRKTIRNSSI